MRPRKSLGQHFLHDQNVIERIVAAVAPKPGDHLVEIGPGRGAITAPLLILAGRLDAVELDRELAAALTTRLSSPRLVVHRTDALRFDFRQISTGPGSLRLVGNFPYNISTPLLFHLLDHQALFQDLHVMLQKEVVERMAAGPGSKTYGRLSVALAARCRVEKLFVIKSGAFTPAPKVESAFARLIPDAARTARLRDPAALNHMLIQAFSRRRKRLGNALAGLLTDADIAAAGIDPGLRPEAIPPEQFVDLANLFAAARHRTGPLNQA